MVRSNYLTVRHAIYVSGTSLFLAGSFNALPQGFVLRLDKRMSRAIQGSIKGPIKCPKGY